MSDCQMVLLWLWANNEIRRTKFFTSIEKLKLFCSFPPNLMRVGERNFKVSLSIFVLGINDSRIATSSANVLNLSGVLSCSIMDP